MSPSTRLVRGLILRIVPRRFLVVRFSMNRFLGSKSPSWKICFTPWSTALSNLLPHLQNPPTPSLHTIATNSPLCAFRPLIYAGVRPRGQLLFTLKTFRRGKWRVLWRRACVGGMNDESEWGMCLGTISFWSPWHSSLRKSWSESPLSETSPLVK